MPDVSQRQAARIIRHAIEQDRLGAPHGLHSADHFDDGRHCAQGAVFHELSERCYFTDYDWHRKLVGAHDDWGRAVKGKQAKRIIEERRQAFMALLDQADPLPDPIAVAVHQLIEEALKSAEAEKVLEVV